MLDDAGPALDPDYRRARSDVQKRERRVAILLAARQEFDELGFHGFTMRSVAERVHVSKAALYGYHASKHAILASLTAGMVGSWAHALSERLTSIAASEPASLASHVVASLAGRETLVGLIAVLDPCIVPGLSPAERTELEAAFDSAYAAAGEAIERRLPGVASGDGAALARAAVSLAAAPADLEYLVGALLRGAARR